MCLLRTDGLVIQVRHKWNDDYSKMTDCIVEEVEIPKKQTVE